MRCGTMEKESGDSEESGTQDALQSDEILAHGPMRLRVEVRGRDANNASAKEKEKGAIDRITLLTEAGLEGLTFAR